jgi:Leucine-rich repeat (LRR) protein
MKVVILSSLLLLESCLQVENPEKTLKEKLKKPVIVTELRLSTNPLAEWTVRLPMKKLPPAIGQFINLERLDLSGNKLESLPVVAQII